MKTSFLLYFCFATMASIGLDAQPVQPTQQNGNHRSATVYRDDWGIPHVYAYREEDGFFGLGYAQAGDRLEGILRQYLMVQGKSAAVFGPESVSADLHALQWMHLERAQAGFARLEPQLQKDYEFFVAGIRRYMRDHPKEVPTWAPQLEAALPVAVLDAALWGVNDVVGVEDCERGGISVLSQNKTKSDDAGGLCKASNEWVVMPWRTAGGHVIHLSDSHVPFDGEIRAFEFRLHTATLELCGFSANGLVLPVSAHNRNVAWAMTMGGPDVADCYAVDVDPEHPRRYLFDGDPQEMIVRHVTVEVKGAAPVTREFEYTKHNGVLCPVIARHGHTAYAVCSAYMGQTGLVDEQLYRMDLSHDIAEFRQSLSMLGMFAQNVMAGGADGHALYVRAGRVPIRPKGYDWRKPVPGNSSATAWLGMHPLNDLVVVEDPVAGYMANDNVAPDAMTEERTVEAQNYAPEVFYDIPGFTNPRNRRTIDVLSRAYSFSKTNALELALDEKWEDADVWIEALRRALNSSPQSMQVKSPGFRRFADRILNFDGFARKESIGALDYLYWRTIIGENPISGELAQSIENHKELSADQNYVLTNSLDPALSKLISDHGSAEVSLGDIYRIGRGGRSLPIGGVKFQAGGEEITTLRAMLAADPDSQGQRWVFAGQRQPCLTIFSDPIQSFTSAPWGQSDHPLSQHYSDQVILLSERRLKSTYFNRDELLKHVESKTILSVD
jgi:acyl-homoserine lactone acylase PvdQ